MGTGTITSRTTITSRSTKEEDAQTDEQVT